MSPSPSGPGFWTLASTRAGPEISAHVARARPQRSRRQTFKLPLIETVGGTGLDDNVCRNLLSIANEVVRFWQHILCPLLLLFCCGRGGRA
jgi:hypothetical protein